MTHHQILAMRHTGSRAWSVWHYIWREAKGVWPCKDILCSGFTCKPTGPLRSHERMCVCMFVYMRASEWMDDWIYVWMFESCVCIRVVAWSRVYASMAIHAHCCFIVIVFIFTDDNWQRCSFFILHTQISNTDGYTGEGIAWVWISNRLLWESIAHYPKRSCVTEPAIRSLFTV
jgi:hypothetical protein